MLKSTLLPLLALLLVYPSSVVANSIVAQPWQPLVNYADLVGVIECVTAGEIVARYRVVESWKGPKEGTILTVQGAAEFWEPSLPIALCGERLLVAAWNYEPQYRPSVGLGGGPGGSVPPFWRDDHPDYFIPTVLHYRRCGPPKRAEDPMIGGYPGDLNAFRTDVKALLALPDDAREAAVLRALMDWHLGPRRGRTIAPAVEGLIARSRAASADSVLIALNDYVEHGGRGSSDHVFGVLAVGGGPRALAHLSTWSAKADGWTRSQLSALNKIIRRRLGLDVLEDSNPLAPPAKPTGAVMDSMRALIESPEQASGMGDYRDTRKAREAFETLAVYDPDFLASYLVQWSPEPGSNHEAEGYVLGSFFGWRCGQDRAYHMRRLLVAKDPYVRVAGAIYLSFENEPEGSRSLRMLMDLPGDPGAWAALNLARRGDKTAAARALESFLRRPAPTIFDRLHLNLQKRLLVLFSNSADRSDVPQPPSWHGQDGRFLDYEMLAEWWKEHEAELVLHDPWLENWKVQKIE